MSNSKIPKRKEIKISKIQKINLCPFLLNWLLSKSHEEKIIILNREKMNFNNQISPKKMKILNRMNYWLSLTKTRMIQKTKFKTKLVIKSPNISE